MQFLWFKKFVFRNSDLKRIRNQRGQIIILVALTITALLLLTGVAVDGGRLYFYWTGLSRAVDAACAAVVRNGDAAGIPALADRVARFNMQQQGVNIGNLTINGFLTAGGNRYRRVQVNGTLTGIPSMLMQLAGQNASDVAAQATCQACIPDPVPFNIPVPGFLDGGIACQAICNEGTGACCNFFHTWNPFSGTSSCLCGVNSLVASKTNDCQLDGGAPVPVIVAPGDPNPYPEGLDPAAPAVWIVRRDEDLLHDACIRSCGTAGFAYGNLWCNEGCTGRDDTVCCKCHCSPDNSVCP